MRRSVRGRWRHNDSLVPSTPLEFWHAPLNSAAGLRRSVRDVATANGSAVRVPERLIAEAAYSYYSTFHWQWLVNGYSGFFPPSYLRLVRAIENFPDEPSMNEIKSHGARYLVIHGEYLRGDRYRTLIPQLDARRDLTLVSRHPWQLSYGHAEISVYRLSYGNAQ